MKLSTKILLIVAAILIVAVLAFIVYKQVEISSTQKAIETNVVSQKQLVDGIMRSQANWSTREDLDKLIKQNGINLKAIEEDLDKLQAKINAINIAIAISNNQVGTNIPTTPGQVTNTKPIDPKNPDPYGYFTRQQLLALTEDFGTIKVPIGSVGFSAWQKDPWNYDIKGREYHLNTVVGTDENQRQYYYNKFVIKVDGKDHVVPIKEAITKQVYPESKWYWWNPRLFIGMDGGISVTATNSVNGEFTPNFNVGIMSYGRYKNQPDFSILQIGLGYGVVSENPQLVITPFAYNIGKHIPLMNNTYIGPSLSVGLDGNVYVGTGLRFGL